MSRRVWLAALTLLASSCTQLDGFFCGQANCVFTEAEWGALISLAGMPEAPPPDRSNRLVGNADAIALGHQLYFDSRLSGNATLVDTLGRPTPYARSAKGTPTGLSCASCHTPSRAGSDFSSIPNHVSVGAGWYDVNSQQTVNAAFYQLIYWNGRSDSLWAQAAAVMESPVSMASSRLEVSWVLFRKYRAKYEALFPDYPFPQQHERLVPLESDGTCRLEAGSCPADCRVLAAGACVPRIPDSGKPGTMPGCQWGSATEPHQDAFDCMDEADRDAITRVHVNAAKAIAAYEFTLVGRDSAFDRFIGEGAPLPAAAQRGAALFVGKASCVECHRTPFFTDNQFHNVGVPQVGAAVPTEADCLEGARCDCVTPKNCLPWGGFDGIGKYQHDVYRRDGKFSDDPTDPTRAKWVSLELTPELIGTWRTPSLRDVALTAPYMHDGALPTLEAVVAHYNRGGASSGVVGKTSPRIRPLLLTDEEQSDLVAFLNTLTSAPLPTEISSAPVLP